MSPVDIETRLREHGLAWRDANNSRPGVDWDGATTRHRSWAWPAVSSAVVAVGLIVAVLVLTAPGATRIATNPRVRAGVRTGAPATTVVLVNGTVAFVRGDETVVATRGFNSGPAYAVVMAPDDATADVATTAPGCRTSLDAVMVRATGSRIVPAVRHVGTIAAGGMPVLDGSSLLPTMALSPNGRELAMALSTRTAIYPKTGHSPFGCSDSEQLAVYDLQTHATRAVPVGVAGAEITAIAWSPNGAQIAVQVSSACSVSDIGPTCQQAAKAGTHLVNADQLPKTLGQSRLVLPYVGDAATHAPYGPVFWWHGKLVTIFARKMWTLDGFGALKSVVAGNFPDRVDAISSDPSGEHLLLSAGPVKVDANGGPGPNGINFTAATTYRWDNGVLSAYALPNATTGDAPGQWVLQPSW